MNLFRYYYRLINNRDSSLVIQRTGYVMPVRGLIVAICLTAIVLPFAGCVSDDVDEHSALLSYQQLLANKKAEYRTERYNRKEKPTRPLKGVTPPTSPASSVAAVIDPNTGKKSLLGSLPARLRPPLSEELIPDLKFVTDPNTGEMKIQLTVEEALTRTLANSPEITVVSFDPSIAKQDITKAASEFDFTGFGRVNYEQEDVPPNSIFQPGQSDVRTYETGIKQKTVTGAEWSASYALTRSWDDLAGRTFSKRFEPVLGFQLKQPLLRDAWQDVTLAGVNIAKLNYKIALLGFREKSEDIAFQVISAYWELVQVRRDTEIQRELLDRTLNTLRKVEGRKGIDATNVQIKQIEAFANLREATLLQTKKAVADTQEVLIRFMASPRLDLLDEIELIPTTEISTKIDVLESSEAIEIAMRRNPAVQQARAGVQIADINFRVAENQKLPRLDLIASARTQGLHPDLDTSHDRLNTGDFASYAVGLSLEYPFGNRQREAELLRRRLERRQANANLQNVADKVAVAVREGLRRIKTNYSEIQVQRKAAEAAQIHLQTLKDTEPVREQLTPEFLLVKLQAQETLANAQRQEIRALVEFNISLVRLARTLGTVFELHRIKSSMPVVDSPETVKN